MAYEIKRQAHEDHIEFRVFGDRLSGHAVADADAVGKQILEQCRDQGISNILLILELTGSISAVDVYQIVTNSAQYGWSHDLKMAVVDLNPESRLDSQFTETVAVNRAYRVRSFDNERDAKEWLLGD
ncbi:MAG: hypothetical protein OEM60_08190 [Gammaproteobacteria bacterium]|nr:hypothetical protein [Gammaproteobacteria bacterium]MDH3430529.1 hypothetical protein [Gammaproteobacteria bacterium]MDH3433822.1 hypothetical protein [Gammaproteobacteria bacterium]